MQALTLRLRHSGEIFPGFDCGVGLYNAYLQSAGGTSDRCYVLSSGQVAAGYIVVRLGHLQRISGLYSGDKSSGFPVMFIVRLAVGRAWQERGIGRALLNHGFRVAELLRQNHGARAVVVLSNNEGGSKFFQKFDFSEVEISQGRLLVRPTNTVSKVNVSTKTKVSPNRKEHPMLDDQSFQSHPHSTLLVQEYQAEKLGRREFLTRVTSLGLTAASAYGLIGMAAPKVAHAASRGGTLRIFSAEQVPGLRDPRVNDKNEGANFMRGWLEYLVQYNRDGSIEGKLLESWQANEDATRYVLKIRKGVTWNNGDAFTAHDVARNIVRWCDKSVEGNSMASRMSSLVDPETEKAREGAIVVLDDHTVELNADKSDITLIYNMSEYSAAIVHRTFSADTIVSNPIGTGPYLPESYEVGIKGVLVRNSDHSWWNEGNGAWLDRIEMIGYSDDMMTAVAAAEADEIDLVGNVPGEFSKIFDGLDGWNLTDAVTANTMVIRTNQLAEVDGKKPYADVRVRQALALAIDNNILLELGVDGKGIPGENHHVCPIHPEYADLPKIKRDPEKAMALLKEAGMEDFEHDLISIDDNWRKATCDAAAAQLRDAGIKVKRTVIPGASFWNGWKSYPFSSTNWAHRALGVQTLALAYRSGESWNETGFSNAEFDALLDDAIGMADADSRREVMQKLQKILQDEGVIVQPFWQSLTGYHTDRVGGWEMHPSQHILINDIFVTT